MQYFDQLIAEAQSYYNEWLEAETEERLKQQKVDLKWLHAKPS